MNGKGSRQRPFDRKKFEHNYDHIFGRRSKQGRHRDLAALQSELYKYIEMAPRSFDWLANITKANRQDVSNALQGLKAKGSIEYSHKDKVWARTY